MKKYFLFVLCLAVAFPAFGAGRSIIGAAQPAAQQSGRMATLSKVHNVKTNNDNTTGVQASAAVTADVAVVDDEPQPVKVNRDKERLACLSNNIGVGNTFVWASKNSNTANYASMVEDVENPDNNVCFVLVGMRSDDSRINIADVQPRYFEWGQSITCGNWVDEAKMEARILDAKKSARTWGTIGGAVGGAGIGVGAMELFGNKALSGIKGMEGLQGQKQYAEYSVDWYKAKANELKEKSTDSYNKFVDNVETLKAKCAETPANKKCGQDKYKNLLELNLSKVESKK